tara:strand:- start:1239 stop:2222 length:984 start_codon:yes stop_codon:yes gene_type:complete
MGFQIMVISYEVVLATCNGEKYILDQLDSIAAQTIQPEKLIVSDDLSTDSTLSIIHSWSSSSSIEVQILPPNAKRLGSCKNFERLLVASSSEYVMLADQDDIWASSKAEMLFSSLQSQGYKDISNIPLLVHSDLSVVNSDIALIASSFFKYQNICPRRNHWLSIGIQNIVTGCASMVNRKCIQLALPFPSNVIMHDWWLALVASKIGFIIFTPISLVYYRQHSKNVIGAKGFIAQFKHRFIQLFQDGSFDQLITKPILQIKDCHNRFPSGSQAYDVHIQNLTCSRSLIRLKSAFHLKLAKHGIIRTFVYYILLFRWQPPANGSINDT